MYCQKCGKQNKDDARFCKYCGEPFNTLYTTNLNVMENTRQTGLYETYEEPEKESHKGILFAIFIVLFLIVLAIGGLFAYDRFLRPSIDLNDYVVFETTGSSPAVQLNVSIDWDQLEEDHGDEVKYTLLSRVLDRDVIADQDAMDLLKNNVSVQANRTTDLANGDKVTYEFVVGEDVDDVIHVSLGRQRGSYTVQQAEHYLSSRDELDDGTLANAKVAAESLFSEYRNSWAESSSLIQFIYVGNSLNFKNDGHNELDLVYAVQVKCTASDDSYSFDETKQFFWVAKFNDLQVGTGGEVTLPDCTYVDQNEYSVVCDQLNRQWNFYGYDSLASYQNKYLNDPVNYTYDTSVSDSNLPSLPESNSESKNTGSSSNTDAIGTVTVNVSRLNIRESASKSSESLGHAENGKTYKVYEIKKDDDYTWYRIGAGKWIADNGEWVTYKEN